MKTLKRIGLLVLLSAIGAVVLFLYARASMNGVFVQWEYLGKPSETPVEIIRPGFVKTDTGNIYQQSCGSGCWEKIDTVPPDDRIYWKLSSCGSLPPLKKYTHSKAICQPWGVGSTLIVDAIAKDGSIYTWQHSIGEGDSMMLLFSPFLGPARIG